MKWKPIDIVAYTLVIIVGAILLLLLGRSFTGMPPFSPGSAKLTEGLLTSLITIIAMYVGNKMNK